MCTAIKGFIRLIGHYRCFIKDFTKIADPLHEYARGDTTKKRKEWVVLNEAARSAFQKLKKAVMSALVLASPDPNKEYLLKTNALKLGLGAVLSQKQSNGRYHPVALGSRDLHGAEVNYQFWTALLTSSKTPGHQNQSEIRLSVLFLPWWPALWWQPSMAVLLCALGTMKHFTSSIWYLGLYL